MVTWTASPFLDKSPFFSLSLWMMPSWPEDTQLD